MKEKFRQVSLMTTSTFFRNYIENGLFMVLLAFYPFLNMNQGLDVADSTYSLGNFQYFDTADGTWMVATYLSNVLGHALMGLPGGNTIMGMRIYTGLIISVLAVFFYLVLRRQMPVILVFVGEMTAIGLCWCPSVILYNYLTYFLMGIGVWLLYSGCFQTESVFRRRWYLIAAGICLGANIAVRMPNVVQAAFILGLWYSAFLQKQTLKTVVRDTLYCLGGYLVGFGIPLVSICIRYGTAAYPAMIQNMFAMTDQAADYKPMSMLTGMFHDYRRGAYWLAFAAICMAALYIAYGVYRLICRKAALKKACTWLFGLLCVCVWCVLIRFYWGHGMFNFLYYDYGSMYWWAVIFILAGIVGALWLIGSGKATGQEKVLALLVLLQIFLTPLGSNNDLYPIINNLFLAAPFTLWCGCRWFRTANGNIRHLPWQSMLLIFGLMLCIQSVGFHRGFAFGDGVWGEKRDTLITELPKAEGIYTHRENAEYLLDLSAYVKENGLTGRTVILYGLTGKSAVPYEEIPGLGYLLDMPSAISTFWPDLDSNRLSRFEQDMAFVEQHINVERPVVIVASGVAAYYSEDAEAYKWFGVKPEEYDADQKMKILRQFLADYDYEETFANMRYVVYE